jgi:hypothetical protein
VIDRKRRLEEAQNIGLRRPGPGKHETPHAQAA